MTINIKNKKFSVILLILLYILLSVPNSIIASVDKEGVVANGKVIFFQAVPYESFPKGVQDILPENPNYNVILIKDISSPEKTAVIYQGDIFYSNDFIKVEDITTSMYTDPHILPFVDEPFNKLIIGKVSKVKYGGTIIEYLASNNLSLLIVISKLIFYIGGLLIIISVSYILCNSLDIWNIPGVLSSYSFQFIIINILSTLNRDHVIAERYTSSLTDVIVVPFGYLMVLFIPLTIFTKRYVATEKGELFICKMYQYQNRLIKPILSIFNK